MYIKQEASSMLYGCSVMDRITSSNDDDDDATKDAQPAPSAPPTLQGLSLNSTDLLDLNFCKDESEAIEPCDRYEHTSLFHDSRVASNL